MKQVMMRPEALALRSLRLAVVAAAASLSLAFGCTASNAQSVERGGTVVQADQLAVPSLDPHLSNAFTTVLWPNIFDSLFTYTPPLEAGDDYTISPGLAESYQRISDTEIEVKLRQGVQFHDGTPLDAEAVKWNLERARDHELSTRSNTVEALEDVVVVDENTLTLRFSAPQPLFDILFSPANTANVYFVSKAAVESMGDEAFSRSPVGSGPFEVVEFLPDNLLRLAKFDGYWANGADNQPLPYLDEVVIRFIPDQSVAALELRAGGVHIADLSLKDAAAVANDPAIELYSVPLGDRAYPSFYMACRPESQSPFAQDVRLRRAVQHAINREAMAAALGFGLATAHYHWGWYPGVTGYDSTLPKYEYDPELAKQLIKEAGYENGLPLEVKVINRPSDAQPLEIMQAMLAEVGIDLQIVLMDRNAWLEARNARNWEALSHSNSANIEPLMREQTRTGSSQNQAAYSNPEVDALWEEAAKSSSAAERAEIYKKMQIIMHEDACLFIGYVAPTVRAHASDLHGIELTGGVGLQHVWVDQQ